MNTTASEPDEVLVLRPSRLTSLVIAVVCAVAVRGLWEIRGNADVDGAAVWIGIAFFGFGTVLGTLRLLPGASYLRLEPRGFTFCAMFRRHTIAWDDVAEFGVSQRDGLKAYSTVRFNFSPSYGNREHRKALRELTGWEGALPGKYGRSAEELADLMNQWRTRNAGR